MAITRADFPLPDLTDALSAPYYAAAARGELAIPRCERCEQFVWYPRAECPACAGPLTWTAVSGRATLFTWAIVRRPFLPAFADKVPFVTALVALAEDPAVRIPTIVVDAEPESLQAEQTMQVEFRPLEFSTVPGKSVTAPFFRPA